MPRVLLLGFDPDPGAAADASADATRLLTETWEGDADLVARGLPRVFDEAPRRMRAHIAKHLPDAVVLAASAPGTVDVAVERLAVNLDDATAPDATGREPVDRPVVPGAEAALWSTLPVRDIVGHLQQTGVPARLSLSAGSDVANHTFYSLQRELADWGVPSGLVHVPASPEMQIDSVPTVPTAAIAAALRTVVEAVLASLDSAEPAQDSPAAATDDDDEETQPYLMPIAEPIADEPETEPEESVQPTDETAESEVDDDEAALSLEPDTTEPAAADDARDEVESAPEPEASSAVDGVPELEPEPEDTPAAVPVAPAPAASPAFLRRAVDDAPTADTDHAADEDETDTPEEPEPEPEPEDEPQPQRPMTWEEIITGGRG